jgi:alkylhydroperoxidase family enzyme
LLYSEKQLIDLVMTVGQYTTAALLMKTLKIPLDDGLPGFREILR